MDKFIPKNVYKGPLECPHAEERFFIGSLVSANIGVGLWNHIHHVTDFTVGKHGSDFAMLECQESARVRANQKGEYWKGPLRPEPNWDEARPDRPGGKIERVLRDKSGATKRLFKYTDEYKSNWARFWHPTLNWTSHWKKYRTMGMRQAAPPHWGA